MSTNDKNTGELSASGFYPLEWEDRTRYSYPLSFQETSESSHCGELLSGIDIVSTEGEIEEVLIVNGGRLYARF
ncbi:unnamed protein product [Allacma fusca]|uniref:Uncharacterized protein n=1 Tax=Allacma fusca TaxID=39272 RepID=A0A8J2LNG0_9HEXA|nr:unnamed protein product [Allacma fusca]